MTISTGHFAMLHTSRPVSPTPSACPTLSASGPLNTTITAASTPRTAIASVIASRSGTVFQIGRPSPIS